MRGRVWNCLKRISRPDHAETMAVRRGGKFVQIQKTKSHRPLTWRTPLRLLLIKSNQEISEPEGEAAFWRRLRAAFRRCWHPKSSSNSIAHRTKSLFLCNSIRRQAGCWWADDWNFQFEKPQVNSFSVSVTMPFIIWSLIWSMAPYVWSSEQCFERKLWLDS